MGAVPIGVDTQFAADDDDGTYLFTLIIKYLLDLI